MSSDDCTRVHRVLATSLAILTTPLPQTAAPSAHDESLPHSPAMVRLMALAARVAPLDSTILITGESGVGKERLARWLHQASMRTRGPFIAVNCGAFADTILESELFGHARGAFTGAVQDRLGVFEAAAEGTLFLDEVGEVSPADASQAAPGDSRTGGDSPRRNQNPTHRRATHGRDQSRLARGGRTGSLSPRSVLPAPRDRPARATACASGSTNSLAWRTRSWRRRPCGSAGPWSGTPRMHWSACLTTPGPATFENWNTPSNAPARLRQDRQIDVEDLPDAVRAAVGLQESTSRRPLDVREVAYIRAVLARHGGHRRRAAAELGISLSTLKRRLRERAHPS